MLIPKVKHFNSLSYYRPIPLCNTFYKVITKILTRRMKEVLSSLINLAQFVFIRGRDITGNIALAQELCCDFSIK